MANIAAGIVLYNPDIDRLQQNIQHVIHQVSKMILVDNGSQNISEVVLLYKNDPNIVLIQNNENLGIATALNQIMHYCESKNYDWVLTLDQDSICTENFVQSYLPFLDKEQIAILSPNIVDRNIPNQLEKGEKSYSYISKCITSGSLTNVNAWRKVNGFDEAMFIDYVDFDFCCNLIEKGYRIIKIEKALLIHELGKAKPIKLFKIFGKRYYTYNHSSIRTYYYVRNVIYYLRKHPGSVNKKEEIFSLLKWLLVKLIFEKNKLSKLHEIVKGYFDGHHMPINDSNRGNLYV